MYYALISTYDIGGLYERALISVGRKTEVYSDAKTRIKTDSETHVNIGFETDKTFRQLIEELETKRYTKLNDTVIIKIINIPKKKYMVLDCYPNANEEAYMYRCFKNAERRAIEICEEGINERNTNGINGSVKIYKIGQSMRQIEPLERHYKDFF
jgi:hypothetical protein